MVAHEQTVQQSRAAPEAQRLPRWRRAARRFLQIAKLGVIVAVLAAGIYWLKFTPLPVRVHTVQRGEIVAEVLGTGSLEARRKTTISPKIASRITDILVDQGSRVTARQVLVKLDDSELRQQVGIAEATVTAAQAAVERTLADKTRLNAVLAQARREHQRVQALTQRQVASLGEFDKAIETLQVAEANITHASAAISEAQKQLLAAEKTLGYQRARLDDTVITAPFDGLIVRRHRDPGDIVVPGSAIVSLIAPQEVWVSAWVDETRMAQIHAGQPAHVVFRSEPERPYAGQVVRLGQETDRETREFLVDVRTAALPENWAVGQRAEVSVHTAQKSAVIVLPTSFVLWRDERPGVFVESQARAQWRPLQLGLQSRDAVEVLTGLQEGESVVTPVHPQSTLTPGQRVVRRP